MKSYTISRNLFGEFTRDNSSANLTVGDQLINDSIRTIATMRGGNWWWLETIKTKATVASQQAYQIPNSIRKLSDVYVTVGTTIYCPEPVFDNNKWKLVLAYQLGTSDTPLFYYRQGNQILLAPTPTTSSNTITFRGRLNIKDLSIADYTTGTIVSIDNGATTVTGSGTSWAVPMAGRFIRITDSGAANTGDHFWYEISSVTSTTILELVKPYEGTSIAAGSATYNIGQMSPIPESYDSAPVYRATALYFQHREPSLAERYWLMYDGGKEAGLSDIEGGLIGQMLQEANEKVEGPYIPPFGSTVNTIDPNYPQPRASGF